MLGSLKLPLPFGKYFVVHGGPYKEAPARMRAVRMAKELPHRTRSDIAIPTEDYSTPPLFYLNVGLEKALDEILAGKPLYVGCMGGRGRTGLFLAILAKAFGVKDPIGYVRRNYYPHAVETKEQEFLVKSYLVSPHLSRKIQRAKLKSLLTFRRNRTIST